MNREASSASGEAQREEGKQGDNPEQPGVEEEKEVVDLAVKEEYKAENDRHRIIVARVIGDIFVFILKHFRENRKPTDEVECESSSSSNLTTQT